MTVKSVITLILWCVVIGLGIYQLRLIFLFVFGA